MFWRINHEFDVTQVGWFFSIRSWDSWNVFLPMSSTEMLMYPAWWTYKKRTGSHGPVEIVDFPHEKWVLIFHCYVSSPEGIHNRLRRLISLIISHTWGWLGASHSLCLVFQKIVFVHLWHWFAQNLAQNLGFFWEPFLEVHPMVLVCFCFVAHRHVV